MNIVRYNSGIKNVFVNNVVFCKFDKWCLIRVLLIDLCLLKLI